MDVGEAIARYAEGWFPMDDDPRSPELPWYAVEQRTVFEIDGDARDRLRRKVRRSLTACDELALDVDRDFPDVLRHCAAERSDGGGRWITPRLEDLYEQMHDAGFAHCFGLYDPRSGQRAAGILGVVLGRAAMLESMRRIRPHAGNALLSRTLDFLAQRGVELCDIQMPTDHTVRLGAVAIPRAEYERRLASALGRREL